MRGNLGENLLLDDEHRVVPCFVLFEAKEVGRRSSDVGKTPVAFVVKH